MKKRVMMKRRVSWPLFLYHCLLVQSKPNAGQVYLCVHVRKYIGSYLFGGTSCPRPTKVFFPQSLQFLGWAPKMAEFLLIGFPHSVRSAQTILQFLLGWCWVPYSAFHSPMPFSEARPVNSEAGLSRQSLLFPHQSLIGVSLIDTC